MRSYELMYILRPDLGGEEELNAQIERVQGYIQDQGGRVADVEHSSPWGRRRMAYEIDGQQEGYYVLTHFEMDPARCVELERNLKITEPVIRYLLIRTNE
ncbi:MAG: 30S ribosomal protein S6 [Herpetosiphonaceae bacterium]|nr:MAG: 30S ribosomal protein S6 [Herpetosiphonaceae bacterium]